MSCYCLVVLQTPLLAQDLAHTLADLTGCTVIVAETVEGGFHRLADETPHSLLYAFVQSDAATLRASLLFGQIMRLGGRTVLLGHAAEMEVIRGEGCPAWPVLPQPFGATQVAALLERLPPVTTSG